MKLYPLALLAGVLPLLTIHLCYLWAAGNGHLPWCFPYLDNCSSISAGGREVPEYYLFKGLMIPAAVFIGLYWWLTRAWLTNLNTAARRARSVMYCLGITACIGLIIYTVALGAIGDVYRMQRRSGVIVFFGLTYIAQLLLNYSLKKANGLSQSLLNALRVLQCIAGTILCAGLASIVLSIYDEDYYDTLENGFEWTVTLLLCSHLLVTAFMWKISQFESKTQVRLTP